MAKKSFKSGIFHEHKTTINFGGKIGLCAGYYKEDKSSYVFIFELSREYKLGETIDEEDIKKGLENCEVCLRFSDTRSIDSVIESLTRAKEVLFKENRKNAKDFIQR